MAAMPRALLSHPLLSRRAVVAGLAATGTGLAIPGWAASASTPSQTAGPFYPETLPLERDADLARVAGRAAPAQGQLIHVMGRVTGIDGRPVRGARLELWQANAFGRYDHPGDASDAPLDPNFQGYGAAVTDDAGRYRFRTIKPAGYGSGFFRRTPHLHFTITAPAGMALTTQMYFAGEPQNERDAILRRAGDPADRARLIVAFAPAPEIEPEAMRGTFDIALPQA